MIDTRARNLLVTVIDNIKTYLGSAGWRVVESSSSPPKANEVIVIEAFPEKKISGNLVAITYTDIEEPLPVEMGNSKLVRQVRTLGISAVGLTENLAQSLALDCKAYFDSLNRFPFYDGNNNLLGYAIVASTEARRIFSSTPDEWRKFWWMTSVNLEDYYELP